MVVRLVRRRTGAASLLRARPAGLAAALVLIAAPAAADPQPPEARPTGGGIPAGFVGLSIEWSLVDRYMGPRERPVFANLLRNLGSGVLRVGGGSQEESPFAARAADSERVVTAADLAAIRTTLDAVPGWRAVLGTRIDSARRFAAEGVAPAFAGAEREVAGIELGNEPDVTYG